MGRVGQSTRGGDTMPSEKVHVEIVDRIATITLDRAATGNAIDQPTASELREACEQVDREDGVWVVIITGAGDAFCRGTEPSEVEGLRDEAETLRSLKVAESVAAIQKPVIATLNGDAIDQGLEIALACDIRIASQTATFGLTQVKHGFMPWDGGTQRLPRLIGASGAMELVLTSRIVDATEALEMGLVSEVVEAGQVMRRATEIASTMAGHGPIAARYLKEAMLKGLDMTLEQGLRLEADLNLILQGTADRAEGIRSFLERRKPRYGGE